MGAVFAYIPVRTRSGCLKLTQQYQPDQSVLSVDARRFHRPGVHPDTSNPFLAPELLFGNDDLKEAGLRFDIRFCTIRIGIDYHPPPQSGSVGGKLKGILANWDFQENIGACRSYENNVISGPFATSFIACPSKHAGMPHLNGLRSGKFGFADVKIVLTVPVYFGTKWAFHLTHHYYSYYGDIKQFPRLNHCFATLRVKLIG